MNKNSITKEQLWLLLGAYIKHVERKSGIDFLDDSCVPNEYLETQDILLLLDAKKEML